MLGACAWTQELPWSQRMANSAIDHWPRGQLASDGESQLSTHELGTLLNGMDTVWYGTADGTYYQYIKQSIDRLVTPDGLIPHTIQQ
jgi:unsaturated rhamnogalacturonyl hydrolase